MRRTTPLRCSSAASASNSSIHHVVLPMPALTNSVAKCHGVSPCTKRAACSTKRLARNTLDYARRQLVGVGNVGPKYST